MKSITALIPARGGSKGVPNKNIKILGGFPLIAYSIAACKECPLIDRVVVSTDSEQIAAVAESYGAEVPFLRPSHLASDSSTDWQVVNHFFEKVDDEFVAYMRPTTPLRIPEKLSQFVKFFFENEPKMSGMRSMQELPEPPYKMFKIEDGYCRGFFSDYKGTKDYTNLPRQTFPKAYMPNGYIDIAKRSTIEENKTSFGMQIMPVVTEEIIEIDTIHEYKLLEYKLATEGNPLQNLLRQTNDKDKK